MWDRHLQNQNDEEEFKGKIYPAKLSWSSLMRLEIRERNKHILVTLLPDNERHTIME